MSRRATTLVTTGVVLAVLILVGSYLHVPYVILLPGPVTDTLGQVPADLLDTGQGPTAVISIKGATTSQSNGHLYLTTVNEQPGSCDDHPALVDAVRAWFHKTETVQPYQVLCPPGQSAAAVQMQNRQEMVQSQTDAVTAALLELGYHPTSMHITVGDVTDGAPAASVLRPADEILDIDGSPVTGLESLRTLIGKHSVGSSISLTIKRDGNTSTVTTRTIAGSQSPVAIGITPDRVATFKGVDVHIGISPDRVGGPSAGTALALGIVDKLTPGGLTGGRTIAGTGTVDGFGNVGPIGGIQQKIAGAQRAGATVFFAPASECDEAKQVAPKSLTLIKVDTLSTAVSALRAIKSGSTAFPHC